MVKPSKGHINLIRELFPFLNSYLSQSSATMTEAEKVVFLDEMAEKYKKAKNISLSEFANIYFDDNIAQDKQ